MKLPVLLEDMRSVDSRQITPIHRRAAIHFFSRSCWDEVGNEREYYIGWEEGLTTKDTKGARRSTKEKRKM